MMINTRLFIIFPMFLIAYGFLFMAQDQHISFGSKNISPALPTRMLDVLGHSYLNQLIAEILFIKTAVYYGGLNKRMDEGNLEIMGHHFTAMSRLHPRLLDIYYRSEALLAHIGDSHARTANRILEKGRTVLPDQVALPFFEGFNYFHYLDSPIRAAKMLRIASSIPRSPKWIGHLASLLMASGGNIRTGLIWLKGMLAATQDKDEKARYRKDILIFEKAMQVQLALDRYAHRSGKYPDNLAALLPTDLDTLPVWENGYRLEYQPPKLFLRRQ